MLLAGNSRPSFGCAPLFGNRQTARSRSPEAPRPGSSRHSITMLEPGSLDSCADIFLGQASGKEICGLDVTRRHHPQEGRFFRSRAATTAFYLPPRNARDIFAAGSCSVSPSCDPFGYRPAGFARSRTGPSPGSHASAEAGWPKVRIAMQRAEADQTESRAICREVMA